MFLNKRYYIFLILYFIFINPASSINLLSYKATYVLNVEKIVGNTFLEGGQGQTIFEITEKCEGWEIKENYGLIYELPNNKTARSFSSFSSFEDKDFIKHSFELNESSELSGQNNFQGYVEKNDINITGSIISKNFKNLSFSKDVLFPTEHMIKLIEEAKTGNKMFTSKVFFGNEDKDLVKIVAAFITKKKTTNIKNITFLSGKMVWPIKLAFYTKEKKQTKPDYEMYIEIDESGLVHSYKVNYGDFELIAKLKKIKITKKLSCK